MSKVKVEVEETNEWEDELEKLLESTREKYEQNPSSYLSYIYHEEDSTIKVDIPVVCPYCDSLFTTTEEGGLECPQCHWDFEIDDDGDVIYANEE